MIAIASFIDFLKNIAYYTFVISHNVGFILIKCISFAASYVNILFKTAAALLSVVGEDFLVFINDALQYILHILSGIYNIFDYGLSSFISLFDGIKYVIETVLTTVTTTWCAISSGFLRIFTGIGSFFVGMKQLLLLIGSGMWFAITLIPLFVVYVLTMSTYYFGCVLNEVYEAIKQFVMNVGCSLKGLCEFFVDVPLESLIGLLTTACILYIIMKFHFIVYRTIVHYLQITKNYVLSYINVIRNKLSVIPRGDPSSNSNLNNDVFIQQRFCTICQEHDRCILFLPCKHVCVCRECDEKLQRYDRSCPICRTVIKKSMKIYV